jgi:hypothetical protein
VCVGRPGGDYPLARAEQLYSCADDAMPILHDTVIQLVIDRDIGRSVMRQSDSLPTLLMGTDMGTDFQESETQDVVQVWCCAAFFHVMNNRSCTNSPDYLPHWFLLEYM